MSRFALIRFRRRSVPVVCCSGGLFELGSAWANACLIQDRANPPVVSIGEPVSSPVTPPGPVEGTAGITCNPARAESPCLKVCDEVAQITVKWQSDDAVNANIMSLGGIAVAIAIGAMADAAVVTIENAH
jgi:hypothetical protein